MGQGLGPKGPGLAPDSPPDDNPKTAHGLRKPSLHAIPPVALMLLGQAMMEGKRKYGPFNWREQKISTSVYYDAALRHLMSYWDGEDIDPDSGLPHPVKAIACLVILMDAMAQGSLNDDRPKTPGTTARHVYESADGNPGWMTERAGAEAACQRQAESDRLAAIESRLLRENSIPPWANRA